MNVATRAIFNAAETVESGRIRLKALSVDQVEGLSVWLADALGPEWTIDDLLPAVEAGATTLITDVEDETVGIAVTLLDQPVDGAACMPLIAVDPQRRFRGLGGEAGLALERHIRRKFAIEKIYVPAPDGRGLAVYFWLRLGYRPLTASEAPWPLVGLGTLPLQGIWMIREHN